MQTFPLTIHVRFHRFCNHNRLFTTPIAPTLPLSDQDVIEGFLAGKSKPYAIVSDWIKAVVNYLAHHERLSADDIIGDTLEKLIRLFREEAFKGESSLKTYVQRITKYTIVDAARRTVVTRTDPIPDNFDVAADGDPEVLAEEAETKTIYQRMLERISAGCRDIWKKIFVEEKTYKQIAAELGISEGAVKVRVFRCKDEATKIVEKLK
jgi:RNA polymerase sigma factor (sigma-70 family)